MAAKTGKASRAPAKQSPVKSVRDDRSGSLDGAEIADDRSLFAAIDLISERLEARSKAWSELLDQVEDSLDRAAGLNEPADAAQ